MHLLSIRNISGQGAMKNPALSSPEGGRKRWREGGWGEGERQEGDKYKGKREEARQARMGGGRSIDLFILLFFLAINFMLEIDFHVFLDVMTSISH